MASYRLPLQRDRVPLRRRLSSFAAALLANLLLLLVLLRMGVFPLPEPKATQ